MIAKAEIPRLGAGAVQEARADAMLPRELMAPLAEGRHEHAALPSFWRQPLVELGVLFALCLALAVGLQMASRTFLNEFGGHPDEASHYVTGLMVHDYLVGSDWTHPLRFAENYYSHYPRVSLGHWPPFFYVLQAAWTVPFGVSRVSVMLLMALVTALTAATLYHCVRRDCGPLTALVVSLLFVALPLVQRYDDILMADTLIGLLCFWAALCFGRFVDTGTWRSAAAFGILASLAILTKGVGHYPGPGASAGHPVQPSFPATQTTCLLVAGRHCRAFVRAVVLADSSPGQQRPHLLLSHAGFHDPRAGFYSLTLVQAVGLACSSW